MDVVFELELIVDYPVGAYFEYVINVTSQTSAGEGDTVTAVFQTPEEGKQCQTEKFNVPRTIRNGLAINYVNNTTFLTIATCTCINNSCCIHPLALVQ